ncbi:hypothetical protein CKAH01_15850 [Colletotrichum kahawae]|uniref:Rhodopsin domain-containing protein n=1 Tax=Colletotrichum kahawae TaxID=34407 RepID=A0AAD9YHN0_COLKA|nr:hypothetical protein CKAH01_15850 [Colletotrichum kahawae]
MAGPSAVGVLGCLFTLLGLSGLLILARLWLRLQIQSQPLALSDGLLVIAWFSCLAQAVLVILMLNEDVLRPDVNYTLFNWKADPGKLEHVRKLIWVTIFPFFSALYFCKFALLATYLQLFPPFMTVLRKMLYATIAYCVSGYIVSISLQLFLCWPIERNWSFFSDPSGLCSIQIMTTIFHVSWALHFSANLCILAMPFFILKGLQMKRSTVIGIYTTFALGLIDIAISLARFLTIQLEPMSSKSLTMIQMWAILDEHIALIVACIPSLRQYLRLRFDTNSAAKPSYDHNHSLHNRRQKVNPRLEGDNGSGIEINRPAFAETCPSGRRGRESEDDSWSDGKKSSRSDVELVPVQVSKVQTLLQRRPSVIWVDQEFTITTTVIGSR